MYRLIVFVFLFLSSSSTLAATDTTPETETADVAATNTAGDLSMTNNITCSNTTDTTTCANTTENTTTHTTDATSSNTDAAALPTSATTSAAAASTALSEKDETILVKLYPNGEDGGQGVWITKSIHFPAVHVFQRLMQSYVENGVSNGGYNRPLEFDSKVYRQDGQEIKKWEDIYEGDSLYVVPFDAMFMWPGVHVGHKINISKTLFLADEQDMNIEIETLSISPRIFRLRNLIREKECSQLIEINKHNMTRSAVGKVDNFDQETSPKTNRRTSTNNFDVSSDVARTIITRIFSLAHIQGRDAIEDGLQVVRYAQNEAYDVHTDFFPLGYSPDIGMNFDPVTGGSNRYATVFAFLTDDFQGGQTVFPHVSKTGQGTCTPIDRERNPNDDSWTETMTKGMCTNSLAITPKTGDAVLFYSSKTSGKMDPLTEHGGCPVINGTKFGANLWIWNRGKYASRTQYEATFVNELDNVVHLYFFNPQHNPALMLMAEVLPQQTATFLASKGDQFVAHSGNEWVGKFILEEAHHKHRAFRVNKKMDIMNSFEYHIGFGAGVRVGQEYIAQQLQIQQQQQQQQQLASGTQPPQVEGSQQQQQQQQEQQPQHADTQPQSQVGGGAQQQSAQAANDGPNDNAQQVASSSEPAREQPKSVQATEQVATA